MQDLRLRVCTASVMKWVPLCLQVVRGGLCLSACSACRLYHWTQREHLIIVYNYCSKNGSMMIDKNVDKKKKCCLWLCSCIEMFQIMKQSQHAPHFCCSRRDQRFVFLPSPWVQTKCMVIFSATSWIAIKRDWIYPGPSSPNELPQSYIHTGHVCFCLVNNVSLFNALDSQDWQLFNVWLSFLFLFVFVFCSLKYDDDDVHMYINSQWVK